MFSEKSNTLMIYIFISIYSDICEYSPSEHKLISSLSDGSITVLAVEPAPEEGESKSVCLRTCTKEILMLQSSK
jgi:hypothetical protein